jgi:hypothetical protein
MQPTKILLVTVFVVLSGAMAATAAPIKFGEISLWVRAKDSDQSIMREVSQRKLAKALTPQEESTLKNQGASNSLIQSLKSPTLVAAPADVAATEVKSPATRTTKMEDEEEDSESLADNLHVFEIPAGHPVNLSQWGGPDYEFAFNIFRYAGENIIEPVLVDQVRTYTDVAHYAGVLGTGARTTQPHFRGGGKLIPYLGGDLKDDTHMIGDYISVSSHSASRAMSIDRRHPVVIKGSPYTLYPIYGARGASLFYIAHSADSVKLAVASSRR